MAERILVVSEHGRDGFGLAGALRSMGFRVAVVTGREEALRQVNREAPDLALVELTAPDGDRHETCRLIRERSDIPLMVLSASDGAQAVVGCLEEGADSFVVKPIGKLELGARIHAVLRWARRSADLRRTEVRVGDLRIDLAAHRVTKDGTPVPLTPTEFRLLVTLAQRAGGVATHRQLLQEVWGEEFVDCIHYLRLYVSYLRRKLEKDPKRPRCIVSERGVGYRLGGSLRSHSPQWLERPLRLRTDHESLVACG